jgi:hypothetical protein
VDFANKSHKKFGTLTDSVHARTVLTATTESLDRGPTGLMAKLSALSFSVLKRRFP